MKYTVSLDSYRDVFALPKSVVTKHLKLAGAVQLKVLMWLYCNGGEAEVEDISSAIGVCVADVTDAMHYWISVGIVQSDEKIATAEVVEKPAEKKQNKEEKIEKNEEETVVVKKTATAVEPGRPNRMEAIRRADESAEISWLFREAEGLFGRFVSDAERISMVWMVDNLGLESAVVRMIIQHCASIDKCNTRYIEKMALSWANSEIDTVEKAEAHLLLMEQLKKEWATVCSAFGIEYRLPTEKEQNYAHTWIKEWRFNKKMLKLAYD
ncbi:MAG: DnaD domain protein, partial [Clostridia bacterium]|nr:DnaD domain protein [Clostridia bacterium]